MESRTIGLLISGFGARALALAAALYMGSLAAGEITELFSRIEQAQGPRLIGQGCKGAGGDIWAAEESDFPTQCEAIEAWRP